MKKKSFIIALALLIAPSLKACRSSFLVDLIVYNEHNRPNQSTQTGKHVEIFCGGYYKVVDDANNTPALESHKSSKERAPEQSSNQK